MLHTPPAEADQEIAAAGAHSPPEALPGPTSHASPETSGASGMWDCPTPLCFQEESVGLDWEGLWQKHVFWPEPFGLTLWRVQAGLQRYCLAHLEGSGWAEADLSTAQAQELGTGTHRTGKTTLPHPCTNTPQGHRGVLLQEQNFLVTPLLLPVLGLSENPNTGRSTW